MQWIFRNAPANRDAIASLILSRDRLILRARRRNWAIPKPGDGDEAEHKGRCRPDRPPRGQRDGGGGLCWVDFHRDTMSLPDWHYFEMLNKVGWIDRTFGLPLDKIEELSHDVANEKAERAWLQA